jgi:hypothetical protein
VGSRVVTDVKELLLPPEVEPQFLQSPESSLVAITSEIYTSSVGHKIYSKSVRTEGHTRSYSARAIWIRIKAIVGPRN